MVLLAQEVQVLPVVLMVQVCPVDQEDQIRLVMDSVRLHMRLEEAAEVTLEANPGSVAEDGLRALREAGVNRISLGAQSANGEELRMLERTHTFGDVLQAISTARRAGFENLSVDLIYGLPEQTMRTWQSTVRRVLKCGPEHVSAYALTLEHGTPFGRWAARGLLPLPDPDLAADMYEWLDDELESEGYDQYEISNWAREGRQCLHNLQYWRAGPYLGLGAGAHGYANGLRYSNVLPIAAYVDRLRSISDPRPAYPCSPAAVIQKQQTAADDMEDFMIMGLRLTSEGVSANRFRERFGRALQETYGTLLSRLIGLGLLEWTDPGNSDLAREFREEVAETGRALVLSKRGRLLGNRVFAEFITPTSPA